MRIAVGSKNKAKIQAVEFVLQEVGESYSLDPIDAPSNVSGMPFSDEETINGAINRAQYCVQLEKIDVGIGLEGGVTETPFGLFLINWGSLVVKGKEPIIAGGARIKLPDTVAIQLREGKELGPVMDDYCHRENVRHQEGAIGVFTNNLVKRNEVFMHIMKLLIGQMKDRG